MGFLEDLQKKLTAPGGEAFSEERFRKSRPKYLEGEAPKESQTTDVTPPALFDAAAAARERRKRVFVGILLLVLVLLVAAGTFWGINWYRESQTVQKHHMHLALEGPERVTSGEDVALKLRVENGSRVTWANTTVALLVPEGFSVKSAAPAPARGPGATEPEEPVPPAPPPAGAGTPIVWDVGTLPPKASDDFQVTGRLFGEEGTAALFTAKVRLTPENRPGDPKEHSTFVSVVLAEVPIDLTIDVPREAASGTPVRVHIVYQNRLARDLTGARLVLDAPSGFRLATTDPPVSGPEELTWDLPPLPPQGQGEIAIRGHIEGAPESVHPFTANIGFVMPDGRFLAQRQVQRSLVIERSGLTLAQFLNNEVAPLKIDPGKSVRGRVQYKNTGTRGLREILVRLTFEGVGLDEQTVRVTGGFFDSRTKTITWSAASSPELRVLRPGEAGELKFDFTLLPVAGLPFASEADRNFVLTTRAVGDSPDLQAPPGAPKQVATSVYEIFLNTVVSLELAAFYDDGRAGLPPSTGPLPPRVGEETILTVRARVTNTSNDVIDASYRTVLPEGVRWVGAEYHTTGDVSFNDRTRDVLWKIPLLPARAGAALPPPEFAFQVGIAPSVNQVGAHVALTRGHSLEGTDAFTAVRLRVEEEAVTTRHVDPRRAEVVR